MQNSTFTKHSPVKLVKKSLSLNKEQILHWKLPRTRSQVHVQRFQFMSGAGL